MPNPTITTANVGQVHEEILELLVLGNEAVEKGSINVIDGIDDKIYLPRLKNADDALQDRQATPTTPTNGLTYDERFIQPLDVMYYDEFNPRLFESVWRPFQGKGPLVDKVLEPTMQKAILSVVNKSVQKQVGKLIWQGDTTAGASSPLRFFNGIVTQALADSNVLKPTPAGAITSSNVIAVLDAVEAIIPDALYEDPDMCFHMPTTVFRAFQKAIHALTYKGQGPADKVPAVYNGRAIKHYSNFTANHVLAAKGTAGMDSGLHAAVYMEGDDDNFKIERLQNNSEMFFIKALFKMGVNYSWGEEMILYKPA